MPFWAAATAGLLSKVTARQSGFTRQHHMESFALQGQAQGFTPSPTGRRSACRCNLQVSLLSLVGIFERLLGLLSMASYGFGGGVATQTGTNEAGSSQFADAGASQLDPTAHGVDYGFLDFTQQEAAGASEGLSNSYQITSFSQVHRLFTVFHSGMRCIVPKLASGYCSSNLENEHASLRKKYLAHDARCHSPPLNDAIVKRMCLMPAGCRRLGRRRLAGGSRGECLSSRFTLHFAGGMPCNTSTQPMHFRCLHVALT